MSVQFPKTNALVIEMGLDTNNVSIMNLTTEGYDELVRDDSGKKIIGEDGTFKTIRRAWPSLADGIRVIDQFIQEGGTR